MNYNVSLFITSDNIGRERVKKISQIKASEHIIILFANSDVM